MNNEQILLDIFKKHHYSDSRFKMQKLVMLLSLVACVFSVIIISIFFVNYFYMYIFVGAVVCIGIAFLLYVLKVVSFNTATLIYMLYLCFVLTPVFWYLTHISGSAPYVSLIIMVAILLIFSGKTQRIMFLAYITLLLVLSVISIIIDVPVVSDIASLIYSSAAFIIAVLLISFYMFSKLKKYEQMHEQFLRGSFRDELTRLFNRKVLDSIMQYEEKIYKTEKGDYILIMLDVDKFKQMNDEHGHVYGDIVLRNIARCIEEKVRSSDFVVRYGGDEFLVIQTHATNESVNAFIKRIEDEMEKSCYLDIKVSVSYGYAKRSECKEAAEVLVLADKRLYEHKESKK